MSKQKKIKKPNKNVSDLFIENVKNVPEWDDEDNISSVKSQKVKSEFEIKSKDKAEQNVKSETNGKIEETEEFEELQVQLSDKDIKIISSVFLLIVFVVSMIYVMSHPDSLVAVVMMFVSLLAFIILVMFERD